MNRYIVHKFFIAFFSSNFYIMWILSIKINERYYFIVDFLCWIFIFFRRFFLGGLFFLCREPFPILDGKGFNQRVRFHLVKAVRNKTFLFLRTDVTGFFIFSFLKNQGQVGGGFYSKTGLLDLVFSSKRIRSTESDFK